MKKNTIMPTLIRDWAKKKPDAIFAEETSGEKITFREMHQEAIRVASALQKIGITSNDTVITMLRTSIDSMRFWMGISWMKAIDVGCNVEYKGQLLEYIITNSNAKAIIIAQEFYDRLSSLETLGNLQTVIVPDLQSTLPEIGVRVLSKDELLKIADNNATFPDPDPWDVACIIYTSGTTGPSKGVIIYWPQLYGTATGDFYNEKIKETDVVYGLLPMSHIANRALVCIAAIYGCKAILRKQVSIAEFWNDIQRFGVTLSVAPIPLFPDISETTFRLGMASVVTPEYDVPCEKLGIKMNACYSMSEISIPIASGSKNIKHGSCGKLRKGWPGYEARIVNEHDQPLPPGEEGELILRASDPWTMFGGYLGMPEKTMEAWRNGWFHTGDLLKCDEDGNFYFIGRKKDSIRRKGDNISCFDVESCVNSHPEIQESACIGVPDDSGFEDEVKIVAIRTAGSNLTPEQLINFLIPIMPRFMIPRYIEFVDSFPRTETLRVQKFKLRENAMNQDTWDRIKAGVKLPK